MSFFETIFGADVVVATLVFALLPLIESQGPKKLVFPYLFRELVRISMLDFLAVAAMSLMAILAEDYVVSSLPMAYDLSMILSVMFIAGLAALTYCGFSLMRELTDE